MKHSQSTFAVIGAGIIGLAVAYKLQKKHPNSKIYIFEKEPLIGLHQSSHNSGVLHCGLYYKPGSLKAKLAVNGIQEMVEFCRNHDIEHEICGKVVVASDEREEVFLKDLYERGTANGLQGLQYLDKEELKKREPYVKAVRSLLVPQEGIANYPKVMEKLAELIQEKGGEIYTSTIIDSISETNESIILHSSHNEWEVSKVFVCCGLHADTVFEKMTKERSPIKIIPFRGEYMELKPEAHELVNHLIYPVPDPQFPFLGVHFTRMISGSKEVGPNAVLATKREGYKNTAFSFKDTIDSITYKGLLRFLRKNLSFSFHEFMTSLSMESFVKKGQKMIPDLRNYHLKKGTAGVRAQALSPQGELLMDFNIQKRGRQIHVLNAPSPGATASLAIAQYIVDEYDQ